MVKGRDNKILVTAVVNKNVGKLEEEVGIGFTIQASKDFNGVVVGVFDKSIL